MVKKKISKDLPNFIEVGSVEAANCVDLTEYRLLRYDEKHRVYVFSRRASRLGL